MVPDKRRIYQLFDAALALPGGARSEFLDRECTADVALRAEVDTLLAMAHQDPHVDVKIQSPTLPEPEDLTGRQFGRFRLLERIGAGGMGVVYRAERTVEVTQYVAVKVLSADLTNQGQAFFDRETQLLARLEHPAVARFIDCGTVDGRAWIAIEFVQGHPIDQYCDEGNLSLRERVQLLAVVSDAVAAAHRALVVHRDIKPTNVLVTAEGQPKLIDFGIASTLTPATAGRDPTVELRRLFTPGYAAPEQVLGEPVTVATDVFGLGSLAHRLIAKSIHHADAQGAIRYSLAVIERDPELPSVSASRAGCSVSWARALRGDLDAILLKALARDPVRRYADATELANDFRRYLDRLPVKAHRPSLSYRLGKFLRRHSVAVAASAAVALALIAGVAVYAVQAQHVRVANETAARRGQFLEKLLASADPREGRRDVTVAEVLDRAAQQTDHELATEPLVAASLLGVLATTNQGLGRFAAALDASTRQLALLRRYGGSRSDLADALDNQGDALISLGRPKDAVRALRESVGALGDRCDTQGELAQSYDLLGIALANSHEELEAERDYRHAVDCYQHLAAPVALKAAYPLDNLQVLLANQGRYAEALVYGAQALELARKLHGPEHPDTLAAEINYAGSMVNDGRFSEAELLFRSVLSKRARILGEEHLDTLQAVSSLADDLNEQHRYAEAARLERPAAEALDRVVGREHPLALYAWSIYGVAACNTPDGENGLTALNHTLDGRSARYGPEDWRTQSTAVSVGACLVTLHRYEQAEPLLRHAAEALEKARGASFLRTQIAYENLRESCLGQGDQACAEQWARKIAAIGK